MNNIARKTAIVYMVLLAMSGLILFIYLVRTVILQLTIALILAVALEPLVGWLMKRGIGRSASIAISVTSAALAILFVVGIIATPLITEGIRLSRNAPQIVEQQSCQSSSSTVIIGSPDAGCAARDVAP
jgi:predicted PurR-regulated permease PerM